MAWESALVDKESTILDLWSQNDRLHRDLLEAKMSTATATDDRDRIQLRFNELTRTVQTLQRDRDEIRTVLDQSRASTATQETELARLRSEASASQQSIETLRRQLETNTAATREAQLRSSQEQQKDMKPPANLPSYSSARLGTPSRSRADTPSSNYDSRPPNYSHALESWRSPWSHCNIHKSSSC